jgi:hypothetical protein
MRGEMSNILVTIGGIWIAFDGAFSIYKYEKQSIWEHLIRVARIAVGVALAVFGLTI